MRRQLTAMLVPLLLLAAACGDDDRASADQMDATAEVNAEVAAFPRTIVQGEPRSRRRVAP